MGWERIETAPQDGFFLVHDSGATRTMLRVAGVWRSTSVGINVDGDIDGRIIVRETGIYEPTHWMEIPEAPTPPPEGK